MAESTGAERGLEKAMGLEEAQDAYYSFSNSLPTDLKPYLSILFTLVTRKPTQDYKRCLDKLNLDELSADAERIKQHIRLSLKPRRVESFEKLVKLMESVK